jgi:hypothetical protein
VLQKKNKMDRLMPGSSAFIPSKPKSGKKRQKVLSEDSDSEGPSKLEKVGKKKKKQAFSQRSYRFYLPGLDLPKDSKAHYPDFNWLDLVAKEEEAKGQEISVENGGVFRFSEKAKKISSYYCRSILKAAK